MRVWNRGLGLTLLQHLNVAKCLECRPRCACSRTQIYKEMRQCNVSVSTESTKTAFCCWKYTQRFSHVAASSSSTNHLLRIIRLHLLGLDYPHNTCISSHSTNGRDVISIVLFILHFHILVIGLAKQK